MAYFRPAADTADPNNMTGAMLHARVSMPHSKYFYPSNSKVGDAVKHAHAAREHGTQIVHDCDIY